MRHTTLISLYSRLFTHARSVFVAWGLGFAVLLVLAVSLRLDTGSSAFFPDSSPAVRRMAKAMDMLPFSRLLFVDLHWQSSGQTMADQSVEEELALAADALLAAIPADLATRAGSTSLPAPGALLSLLPSVLDEDATNTLVATLTSPAYVTATLHRVKDNLGGIMGGMSQWIQVDPFNMWQGLLPALPLHGALPLPDPILGYAFSPDSRHVLLTLRPTSLLHDVDAALALMDALENAMRSLPPEITATVVGGHRHTAVNSAVIMADIERIVLLSLVGFSMIYLVLVRSVSALWLVLVPCVAALFAAGTMALVWPVVSGLALGFGASILGLAEDYAVHVHFALRTRFAHAQPPLASRLAHLTPPLVQSLLMNCAGFAVLLFSGIPAVRQLAFFAMATLFVGLGLALTLLPLCPWHDRSPLAPLSSEAGVPREPVLPLIAGLAFLLAASLYFLYPQVRTDVSPRTLGADMLRLEADAARLQAVWGDSLQATAYVVHADTLDAALDIDQRLTAFLRGSGVSGVLTISDVLPPNRTAQGRMTDWQTRMDALRPNLRLALETAERTQGFSAKAFAPFWLWFDAPAQTNTPERLRAAGLGDMVDMFVNSGSEVVRTLVVAHGVMPPLPVEFHDAVLAVSPQELERTLQAALREESQLLPVVLVLVFGMLIVCVRRPGRILLASLPPIVALTGVLGWMVWSGTPLTLASLTALPLMLSLAMDHGLVVTHDLVSGASLNVERSMLVSSLTSIMGMGLLAMAAHPALKGMGQVIVIGLTLEFITARWLLPRLCRPVASYQPGSSAPTSQAISGGTL